jgi:hypothetical protein
MFVINKEKFIHMGYNVSVRLLFSFTTKVHFDRSQHFYNYRQSSENYRTLLVSL